MDATAAQRLDAYFSGIGDVLGHPLRRESFATYALGLLGDAERKSVEPIAARACPDPARVDAVGCGSFVTAGNHAKFSYLTTRRRGLGIGSGTSPSA